MTPRDAGNLEQFLRDAGASDTVVRGGLEVLLVGWERTVGAVEAGYAGDSTVPVTRCLWGMIVADEEGWSPDDNWWYYARPLRGAPAFLEEFPSA